MNSTGPRIVPCGTPYFILPISDSSSFTIALKFLSVREVLNQENAKPVIPSFSNSHRSVWWSTASKAALRSRSTRTLHLPSTLLHIKSLYTLHYTVWTEWNCLYADWNWGKKSKSFKCFSNCCKQAYSVTLDKNEVLYKGRYEFKTSGALYFFSIGLIKAKFSHSGKVPDLKEQLTRLQ